MQTTFNKTLWTECCTKEGVRFAKKGTEEYIKVMKRYRRELIRISSTEIAIQQRQRDMEMLVKEGGLEVDV